MKREQGGNCPFESCGVYTSNLARHMRKEHGKSMSDYRKKVTNKKSKR